MYFLKKVLLNLKRLFLCVSMCITFSCLLFVIDFIIGYNANIGYIVVHTKSHKIKNLTIEEDFKKCLLVSLFCMLFIVCCIFVPHYYSIISNNIKEKNKIKKDIIGYCKEFVKNYKSLTIFPVPEDINKIKNNVKYNNTGVILVNNILIPLIINKIKTIEKMKLLKKYRFFYKRNIKGINFGKLSTYDINEEEVNKLLLISNDLRDLLRANRYITVEVCKNISNHKSILNIEDNIDKNEKLLVMYFDTQLILQNIVTQAFLGYGKDNDIVKEDILKQIINSNETKQDKNKILINIIKTNIINYEKFKKVFFETVNNNKIILDIIQ